MAAWARRAREVVVFCAIFRSPILFGGVSGGGATGAPPAPPKGLAGLALEGVTCKMWQWGVPFLADLLAWLGALMFVYFGGRAAFISARAFSHYALYGAKHLSNPSHHLIHA